MPGDEVVLTLDEAGRLAAIEHRRHFFQYIYDHCELPDFEQSFLPPYDPRPNIEIDRTPEAYRDR